MRAKTSGLKSRVDRLYRRTHGFVSHADLVMLARYYEAKLEECEKSENFDENFRKHKEIEFADPETTGPEKSEIVKNEEGFYWKSLMDSCWELCEACPQGEWFEKRVAEVIRDRVPEAKAFFNTRKEKDGK